MRTIVKWIIVLTVLLILVGVVCSIDTASGMQLVRTFREWCTDWQDMLPNTVVTQPRPLTRFYSPRLFPPLAPTNAQRPPPPAALPTPPPQQQPSNTTTPGPAQPHQASAPLIEPRVPRPALAASSELEAKAAVQRILGVPFEKIRPSWLRNPATKRNLELDMYNPVLQLGIEVSGAQHFVFPNAFHKTPEEFQAQQYRDALKRELCQEMGVSLIVVPFTVKRKDIQRFLEGELAQWKQNQHAA